MSKFKFESKEIQIKPMVGLGAIRFRSGMISQLPHIEYENTHDYPIAIYAEITNDTQRYLSSDVYILSKQFFFKPKEKRIIQLEAFRRNDDRNPIFGRGAFNVTIYEIPIMDPEYVKKMINEIVDSKIKECKTEKEVPIEEVKEEVKVEEKDIPIVETVNDSKISDDEDMDTAFADKYCKGIKGNPLYEKWVEAGRPKEVFKYERPLNASIYLNKILASSNNQ